MKIIRLIYLTLILCTLISTFFVMNCSAGEDKFGISLGRYNSVNEKIDYSEDIILVLTIVNNYDYWISIGGKYNEETNFEIDLNNGERTLYYNKLFADEIFIEPKFEFKIFIPFDYYNGKKNLENGKIRFMEDERSYKLHGLGHLTNPFPNSVEDWHAEIWQDILKLHYGQITGKDIQEKYSNLYAISQLTVSTSNVLNRFKKLNDGKLWKDQIKPFNFFLVGFQAIEENDMAVKPLAPFTKDYQKIVYEPFIDYETGEVKEGSHYFKPLSKTILQYVEHLENKFDGEVGVLKRRDIQADGFVYIGKEANNIDDQPLDVTNSQVFINEESIRRFILNLTPEEARKLGVKHRSALAYLKKKAKEGKLNLKSRNVKKIVSSLP